MFSNNTLELIQLKIHVDCVVGTYINIFVNNYKKEIFFKKKKHFSS